MSGSAQNDVLNLISEALAALVHSAAILRLASMEASQQELATELWRQAKAVEELVDPLGRLGKGASTSV